MRAFGKCRLLSSVSASHRALFSSPHPRFSSSHILTRLYSSQPQGEEKTNTQQQQQHATATYTQNNNTIGREEIERIRNAKIEIDTNPSSETQTQSYSNDSLSFDVRTRRGEQFEYFVPVPAYHSIPYLGKLIERTGVRIETRTAPRRGVAITGPATQATQARDILAKMIGLAQMHPTIEKMYPDVQGADVVLTPGNFSNQCQLQLAKPMEGTDDYGDAESIGKFVSPVFYNLENFQGEIIVLGRFGQNVWRVPPEMVDVPLQLPIQEGPGVKAAFIPSVDSEGMLSKLPGAQEGEAMDIRLLIKDGNKWHNVTLRLGVVDGKLVPHRALGKSTRWALDQISLFSNADIRTSVHSAPVIADDDPIFPKINEFFDSISLRHKDGVRYLKVHKSPEFFVYNVRLKRKKTYLYKGRYNIDISQVYSYENRDAFSKNATSITLQPPVTEIEISDLRWRELFEHNFPNSTAPAWSADELTADIPAFMEAVRSLALLVRHKKE